MIRLAIIGYGRAGEAHARCYASLSEIHVTAIVDPAPSRQRAAQTAFPRATVVGDLSQLNSHLDLVLVCTPPSSHEHYTEQALLRGAHVFCEKPVFLDPDNGARLVRLARSRNRIIYPGHNYIHSPLLKQLRQLSRPDLIGPTKRIELTIGRTQPASGTPDWNPAWRSARAVAAGGILTDHGPHCIYLTEWLSEQHIQQVSCRLELSAAGIEDHVNFDLDLSGGVNAAVNLSWRAMVRTTEYRVEGSDGFAIASDTQVTVSGPRGQHLVRIQDNMSSHAHDDWMPDLARAVIDQLSGDAHIEDLAEPALVVAKVIAAAYASHASGGEQRHLP
jgi:predicted dehydrogenase